MLSPPPMGRLPAPGGPPRWAERLARACQAAPTRRSPPATRSAAAQAARRAEPGPDGLVGGRLEPHARAPAVADRRGSVGAAQPAPGAAPARAAAARLTRLVDRDHEVCVGNLHLTAGARGRPSARRAAPPRPRDWAARRAAGAGRRLQPAPGLHRVFDELCDGATLCGHDVPDAIDHLLARGLGDGRAARPRGRRRGGSWTCPWAWSTGACGCPITRRSRPLPACDSVSGSMARTSPAGAAERERAEHGP